MATKVPTKRKWGAVATVTLIVGESKTPFHLHEENLFEASPFFKTAFNSNFKEGWERTMSLPEDDVVAFEDFAEWLYTRNLGISPPPPHAMYMALLKLFVLADKYHVTKLKNIITEKIFTMGKDLAKAPLLDEIAYTYAHTAQSSGIRKLLADWHTWNIDLVWFERPNVQAFLRQNADCAADFSLALAKRLRRMGSFEKTDPFLNDMPEEYKDKDPRQKN